MMVSGDENGAMRFRFGIKWNEWSLDAAQTAECLAMKSFVVQH